MFKFYSRAFPLLIIYSIMPSIAGFSNTGISWVLLFLITFILMFKVRFINKNTLRIWSVWILVLTVSLSLNFNLYSVHFTLQILAPILIYIIARSIKSKMPFNSLIIEICNFSIPLIFYIIFQRFITDIIGGSLLIYTSLVSALWLFLGFETNQNKYFLGYILFTVPAFIFVARLPIFISLLSPILFMFFKYRQKRAWIILIGLIISLVTINIPSVKNKMLLNSSQGYITSISNQNIRTSGRSLIWLELIEKINTSNILFGNGSRSSYFVIKNRFNTIHEPHNDYLRILYEYGTIGLTTLIVTLLLTVKNSKSLQENRKFLNYILLTCLLFCMLTDNALLYVTTCFGFIMFIVGVNLNKSTL